MSKLRLTAVSLVLVGLATSCGDSTSGSTGIAFADLPIKYAEAACAAYEDCLGPVFALFLNGTDCAELTAKRLENGTFSLMEKKIEQKTIRYEPAKAQACLDAVATLNCDELLNRDQPACLAALDGTVAIGGDCDLSEECKGSAICQSSDGTCPGKCVALLSAGQSCSADGEC